MRATRSFLGGLGVAASLMVVGCGGDGAGKEGQTNTKAKAAPSFADIVAAVRSGVIRIEAETCSGTSVGTGFLVGPRLVATVEHVVDGAASVTLKRGSSTLGSAVIIGQDRERDIALLRANKPLEGHQFGLLPKSPRLGEEVAALGFPLGLPLSVTRGSVSGLRRSIEIEGLTRRRLVQTDAAVNQGNSGGPLLTADTGEVVGLVDLGTTEANGIAFAVSAEVAGPLFTAWRTAPQPAAAIECDYYDDSPPAEAAPPEQTPAAAVETFDGDYFSIDYPRVWNIETAEESKGSYLDTTIRDPSDENVMVRVDVTPSAPEDLATSAGQLAQALSRLPGYQELDFSRYDFMGYDAIRWEFLVEEDGVLLHKVDIFFMSGPDQFAVLTQAPASEFAGLSDVFDAVRGSIYVY